MRKFHGRRVGAVATVMVAAAFVLSGCMDVTYSVNVNPDSTVSGSIVLDVDKQAASLLGITSAADLDTKLKSGDLTDETQSPVLGSCAASESSESLTLRCSFESLPVTDVSEDWSLTSEGDLATLHIVSNATAGDSGLPTDASLGTATMTVTFPGEITNVTGDHATTTSPNSVTIKSDISQPIDVSITAGMTAGGSMMWLVYVLLGVLALVVVAILVVVLRRGSKGDPEPNAGQSPAEPAVQDAPVQEDPSSESPDQQA
ncbi:MAG: hypothetical protein WC005_06370 [Candidatus Nanopelagicales bacterium]